MANRNDDLVFIKKLIREGKEELDPEIATIAKQSWESITKASYTLARLNIDQEHAWEHVKECFELGRQKWRKERAKQLEW